MTDISIRTLSEAPQHLDTVSDWLYDEWDADRSESLDWLQRSNDRPGAVLALHGSRPIGVLAYKRHQAKFQRLPELWVNALFVVPAFRRRGIARELLSFGGRPSYVSPAREVFVYTHLPQLYVPCGWRDFKIEADEGMHTLVLQIG